MNYQAKDYYSFMNDIDTQVEKTKKCKGYEAFRDDVHKLKQDNRCSGLSAITANIWLKKICELKDNVLFEYVEQYKMGTLNAWKCYK